MEQKIFGRKNQINRDGKFASEDKSTWSLEEADKFNDEITKFYIKVSGEQYVKLLAFYEKLEKSTRDHHTSKYFSPYDYAIFGGRRCASSALSALIEFGIIPDQTGFLSISIMINPGHAYRYLMYLAFENGWIVLTNQSVRCIIQENGKVVELKYNKYKPNRFDRKIKRKLEKGDQKKSE